MASLVIQEIDERGFLCPPPSIGTVARHLPCEVDEDLPPVTPISLGVDDPKHLTLVDIN
jgi:hypothetical protein